jgi:hypothetical protein
MAGLYADVPGFKMQYDLDGSAGYSSRTAAAVSSAEMTALNGETGTQFADMQWNAQQSYFFTVIFPELRDVVGGWGYMSDQGFTGGGWTLETSANTTTGADGTWTSRGAITVATSMTFRTSISTYSGVTSVKAARLVMGFPASTQNTRYLAAFHLYGNISTGQSLDRLRIWHPTLDQEIGAAGLDFGDFGRGGTLTRTFRIKNNSSSLTANSIVISAGAITDTTPAVAGQITYSQGGSFAATQNIGNLAPGAISALCTIAIASTSSEQLGTWRQRLIATAGSWT